MNFLMCLILNTLLIVSSLHVIQVEIRSIGKICKIRLGHAGTSEQPEGKRAYRG